MSYSTVFKLIITAMMLLVSEPLYAEELKKEHLETAKAAIKSSRMFERLDGLLVEVTLDIKSNLIRSYPTLGPQIDEVTNKMALKLAYRRIELDVELEKAWAEIFTQKELEEIMYFLETSSGKKWVEQLPRTIESSGVVIRAWEGKIREEMLVKIREELIKRGHKL